VGRPVALVQRTHDERAANRHAGISAGERERQDGVRLGLSVEAAEREAIARFGDPNVVRDEVRE
jgi:hypothetical protein